jgi:predicted HTH domain antitoxin
MSAAENLLDEHNLISWEIRQLVKSGLYPDEQATLRSALRSLFEARPQARTRMVISACERGEIGLGRAAALLGVSLEEMKDILREAEVELQLGPLTVEELLEDARHA